MPHITSALTKCGIIQQSPERALHFAHLACDNTSIEKLCAPLASYVKEQDDISLLALIVISHMYLNTDNPSLDMIIQSINERMAARGKQSWASTIDSFIINILNEQHMALIGLYTIKRKKWDQAATVFTAFRLDTTASVIGALQLSLLFLGQTLSMDNSEERKTVYNAVRIALFNVIESATKDPRGFIENEQATTLLSKHLIILSRAPHDDRYLKLMLDLVLKKLASVGINIPLFQHMP